MNLLFLHGRPATGKLTIARKLVTLTGYQLYHNHVAVDEALQLHAFGTAGFVQARDRLWRTYLMRVAGEQPAGVIFTFNPENSVPQEFINWLFDGWATAGGTVLSVELGARESVIESRIPISQRRHFKKLTDPALYRQLRAEGAFDKPVIPRSDLRIDTGRMSPDEAAREIVARFDLKKS